MKRNSNYIYNILEKYIGKDKNKLF